MGGIVTRVDPAPGKAWKCPGCGTACRETISSTGYSFATVLVIVCPACLWGARYVL